MSSRSASAAPAPRPGLLRPTAAAFAVAVLLAFLARGIAGDEEAAHYLIARFAPGSPDLFVSLVGRPLVTLVLTLPAQAGFLATRLAGALATALAAYALARTARRTGWLHPAWVVGLLLIQPFFLAHAATAMTEPWTAALVAVAILAYVERRMLLLAVAAALLPLARFEAMVFWPLVVWTLFREGRLRHVWLLALPLPLWNLGGWLTSGDPLWLLHQTDVKGYPPRSPFHYVQSLAWILGAGLPAPVVLGLTQAWRAYVRGPRDTGPDPSGDEARHRALIVSASILTGSLLVYTALAWWQPVTYGNLRYFAFAAPAVALLGAAGIRTLIERETPWVWAALGAGLLAAFTLWGHPLLGDFIVLERRDVFFGLVTLPWLALAFLPLRFRTLGPALALVLGAAGLVHHHAATLHLTPTPEQEAVRRAAGLLADGVAGRVPLHSAHPLLAFYAGGNLYDPSRYPRVTDRTVDEAPPGTLMFWESHYSAARGPSLTLNAFLHGPDWTYLGGTVARDSTWAGAFFLRGTEAETTGTALLRRDGLGRDAWAPLARLAESGVPLARVATREDPRNAERWLDLAILANAAGLPREAFDAHQRAVALAPDNPRNHAVRADALWGAGRLDDAYRAILQALALEPESGEFHLIAAHILMGTDHPEDARPHLSQAADQFFDRWDVQYMAGRFHFDQGEWAEAEGRLLETIRLNPRHVGAANFAARAQVAQGKLREAETTLRDLIRRRPRDPEGYQELGDLLHALRRPEEALAVWRRGLAATGGNDALAYRDSTGSPPLP